MARYCFYCGKELASSERCTCRFKNNADNESSNSTNQQDGFSSSAGASGETHTSANSQKTYQTKNEQRSKEKKANPFQRFTENFREKSRQRQPYFRNVGHFFFSLFTRPTDIIKSSHQASIKRLIISYFIYAFVFSTMIFTFVRYSSINRFTMIQEYAVVASLFNRAFFSGLRGLFAAILLSLARFAITHVVVRIFGRIKLPFLELAKAYLPGTYYDIIILLFSMLFVAGSGIQTLVMLMAAFSLRTIIDYLSLKERIHLNPDRCLFQIQIINLLVFIVFSFLIRFSVPNLVNFGIVPNEKKEESFTPNLVSIEESNIYNEQIS